MGSRLVPVENVEQMLGCWEASILLFCMGTSEESEDETTYSVVRQDWSKQDLVDEYESEETWRKNEWRIRLED